MVEQHIEHAPAPLSRLIDSLRLLVAQVQVYARTLPANNYQARAMLDTFGVLADQALNEALQLGTMRDTTDPDQVIADAATSVPPAFSRREYQVLALVVAGLTNKAIAYQLHCKERTVQFHLRSIFNKTAVHSRTELAVLAVRSGWL